MIAQPKHGRKLALTGIALTMERYNQYDDIVSDVVRNQIEKILINTHFFKVTPFSWITLAVRYGLKNEEKPHYQKINQIYGDLPLAIEIDVNETVGASLEVMKCIVGRAVLVSVIHAGKKYSCPVEALEIMLDGLPNSLIMDMK